MTDSENSQPQDDSDEDIYKDIPEFNFEEELAKLEGSKENYKQEANDLSEKVKNLTEENKELKKSNEVLKRNLSVLLKTAQAEVQRKDSLIEELRSKVDSFTFRRNKKPMSDKVTSTEDLNCNFSDVKQVSEKQKKDSEKSVKSYENRTSSDSERKPNQGEEKKLETGKQKNINCDNRKSSYHREQSQNSQQRQSSRDGRKERHKERKSSKYEDSSGQRRPFRESHRDHLQYDSFDNKRHSRSSDNRFLSRRRSSRERRRDHRHDSSDRRNRSRRREESEEKSRRESGRKSRSVGSKESSLEKLKSRSSLDSDLTCKSRGDGGATLEALKSVGGGVECKKRAENIEKGATERGGEMVEQKTQSKKPSKNEKKNSDVFSTKSPLDALYNDMVSSRSSKRFSSPKLSTAHVNDLEDGELSVTENESKEANEDWALSFKNERKNEPKPMTLYSKRMMRKLSLDSKVPETGKKVKKEKQPPERKSLEKPQETEKEPGELTDDENIIESSKEFQELTKVAAIESEMIEPIFSKEASTEEFVPEIEDAKTEQIPKDGKELEKEELTACKEIEISKETRDIIEFSPFKNNYKLIEISLIKSPGSENVLDYYNKKLSVANQNERDLGAGDEKTKLKNDAGKPVHASDVVENSGNNSELQVQGLEETETVEKTGKEKECEEKDSLKKSKEEITSQKSKKVCSVNRETEERARKTKRKFSETEESKSDAKKPKLEKTEPSRKNLRSKRNSKSEGEGKLEAECSKPESQKEDISSFEFFKPIAKTDPPETPIDVRKTDYKMSATMSVVSLETPNKCGGKVKNLMINEQVIFNVFDSKNNSSFSPLIGSKSVEMTPRRLLKNDLMLTDSEDDTALNKKSADDEDVEGEEEEEEEGDKSDSEYSECDSDSGASDFVDLL